MKSASGPRRAGALAGPGVLLALVLLAPFPVRSADRGPDSDGWLDRLAAFYEADPELRHQRGTGWKPYNRILWETQRRTVDGRLPTAGARWEAWQEKVERERGRAPRSGWFEIGPVNLSGRVLDIDFHPGDPAIVYAGSASGGLWKSTDGGDTWHPITEDLPTLGIGAVCVLPWNPDVVLIGTGEGTRNYGRAGGVGVLKSTDAGSTWSTTSLSYPALGLWGHGFHVMEANAATGTILAGAVDGLWRSTDEGDTWVDVRTGGQYFDVKWKPGDPGRVYCAKGASTGNNVKVSTDDGLTWVKAGTGQPPGTFVNKTKIGVSAAEPSTIYAHYVSDLTYATLAFMRSTDDGATWQARTSESPCSGAGWYNLVLAVDPVDADHVITGGVELFVSTDAGSTFTEVANCNTMGSEACLHVDMHGLVYEPGSATDLWVATDGGLWKSTDGGAHWFSRREGMATYQFYDIGVAQSDPFFLVGGTQDNGTPGRESGADWFTSTFVADGTVSNIDPTNADIVYTEEVFGNHVKSTDGGRTWAEIQQGLPVDGGDWVTPVDLDQTDPERLITTADGSIFRTTNGGASWEAIGGHPATWISISPVDGDVVWTVHDSTGVRLTTDDGGSWAVAAPYGVATGPVTRILAHPVHAGAALVTFGGYDPPVAHLTVTTDYGVTWVDATGDFPDQPMNALEVDPLNPDHWYAGTDVGVWISTNGGANWSPFGAGLPNAAVYDVEIRRDARKLVAGTHGRGAWEVSLPAPGTGAAIAVAPTSFRLMLDPPRPNPTAGRPWLRYAARHDGVVTLEIYDVRGRRVSRVAEHPRGDGVIRMVSWSADVPGGVYFAVLSAGGERTARRIVLTR